MNLCNGCGCCCDPVMLPYSQLEAMTAPDIEPATREFALTKLTPITPKEAHRRAPWLRGKTLMDRHGTILLYPHYYECSNFDAATRSCTAYDERPAMCSGYPWYGAEPDPMVEQYATLPPPCGFRVEIGLDVTPLDEYMAAHQ